MYQVPAEKIPGITFSWGGAKDIAIWTASDSKEVRAEIKGDLTRACQTDPFNIPITNWQNVDEIETNVCISDFS